MLNVIFQDGTLRNGDHLLAVGDVRLWGMGAEQVASILRQAGQDSIRLVVARPVDPSVPQFAVRIKIIYLFIKLSELASFFYPFRQKIFQKIMCKQC